MSNYDRNKAIAYAGRFWDKVCDDGFVALLSKKDQSKVRKSKVVKVALGTNLGSWTPPDGFNQDDCTHFISCCIGLHGGGLALGKWDIPPAYGSLSPLSLVKVLKEKGYATVIVEGVNDTESFRSIIKDRAEKADLIAYGDSPDYDHMVLHLGEGKIACHTSARFGKDFTDVNMSPLTLLHML
jgi:hypothetical protein